jgi:heme exporter protein C
LGFFVAPTDFQQGQGYRIIFVHVPVSWMSMIIYLAMAFWAFLGLTFNTRLSGMMCRALAPTGAICAFLSLWTGALWGKPMWGTWWVWDARLTSELILFFLYLGYIALTNAIDDTRRADKAGGILALVGALNVPVIYFSVKWWNTLHQGASVSLTQGSKMAEIMLQAMLIMAVAFWLYAIAIALYRVRSMILMRERHAQWVADLPEIKAQFKRTSP